MHNKIPLHPRTWGIETIKTKTIIYYFCYKMKNMNTTLEIPEGSKATIQGKVIDGVADAINDCLCRICDSSNMD